MVSGDELSRVLNSKLSTYRGTFIHNSCIVLSVTVAISLPFVSLQYYGHDYGYHYDSIYQTLNTRNHLIAYSAVLRHQPWVVPTWGCWRGFWPPL